MSAPLPKSSTLPVVPNVATVPTDATSHFPNTVPLVPTPFNNKKNILTKHKPTKKIRSFYWNAIKNNKLKGTIFENITINEDAICLDLNALEELAQNAKKTKIGKKNVKEELVATNKKNKKKKIEFIDDIKQEYSTYNVWNSDYRTISIILFKYNKKTVTDIIKDILNIDSIEDMNYLQKLVKIIPNQSEMKQFENHPKILNLQHTNNVHNEVQRFNFLERLWYYCKNISFVWKRCYAQLLRLEMKEFYSFQNKNINLLKNMYNKLKNNDKIRKIAAMILNIGNFINYSHPTLGNAKGFALNTFNKMKYCRCNVDTRYSLLLYLVEMVNQNYSELADWVNIFNGFEPCQTIIFNDLIDLIQYESQNAQNFRNTLTECKNEDFFDGINIWLREGISSLNKLNTEAIHIRNKSYELMDYFGFIDTTDTPFKYFSTMLMDIKSDWKHAQKVVCRAKHIFIALIVGYVREYEETLLHSFQIPPIIIWTIYIFFPRWNVISISKFIDFSKYQSNQYTSVSTRLPVRLDSINHLEINQQLNIKHIRIPSKKMKVLHWNIIGSTMGTNETIFCDIEKEDYKIDIRLDFGWLEELWCVKNANCRKVVVSDKNSFVVFDNNIKKREIHVKIISTLLFKNNPKQLKNILLNIFDIRDIEYLKKIIRIIPFESEMDKFKTHINDIMELKDSDIMSGFPLLEQLWFDCMDIPLISQRCQLQLLRIEIDEFCQIQYDNVVNLLHNVFNKLYNNNGQIAKVIEIILFIGNYLNFGKRAGIGNVRGFTFNSILKMKDFKGFTLNSTLFVYLVESINQNYIELIHWIDSFGNIEKCLEIGFEEIQYQIDSFKKQTTNFHINIENKENKENNEMNMILNKSSVKINKLDSDLAEIIKKCTLLTKVYCYASEGIILKGIKPIYYNFVNFLQLLSNIKMEWNALQSKFDKLIKFVIAFCRKYGKIDIIHIIDDEVAQIIYMYFPKSLQENWKIKL